jgi:crotonobetainyl-CoA:carnitine CoA-transferase CaiB-like acyl-CoA transferase
LSKPLGGVLVLDLSRVLAGPFCTMMLGDLGARIVKVEHPQDGDVTRGWGPPYHAATGMSAYYLSVNRNKESIALDLASAAGAESVRRLAARADVVVENFPPGGLEKFGLSLAAMRTANPRLVTASITGFGRSGPDASAPGFDLLAQAGAGLMAITGTPEGGPTKSGVAVSDLLAGCYAAIGILAALAARERTGRGAHVETDLFSATLASLINVAQSALLTGEEALRHGNAHPQIVPYRTFAASDGDFVLGVGTDRQFERLAALVGRPEWSGGGPYASNDARVKNRGALERELEAVFARAPRESWVARCRAAGIPAGPVRGPLEALRSETARALHSVIESEGVRFVAPPIRVDGEEPRIAFPPALGADGERLRREFDLPG